MEFSENTSEMAWQRAQGRCECEIGFHNHHDGRCNEILDRDKRWDMRQRGTTGEWQDYHLDEHPNNDTVDNCGIFCWRCYERTF